MATIELSTKVILLWEFFNESQLAFEGLPTKVSLLSESPLSDSFRRAFVEFPESFQRAFGELSESFQRAFRELSESFQRAFVEPAFVELLESPLLESFRTTST